MVTEIHYNRFALTRRTMNRSSAPKRFILFFYFYFSIWLKPV